MLLLLAIAALPQTSEHVCSRHVDPPTQYPIMARLARLQGTIVAQLRIAPNGTVTDVDVETKDSLLVEHPILQVEVRRLVRTWTFECSNCASGAAFRHSITFNYRLDGDGSEHPNTTVSLDLPDKVTIVARPPVIATDAHKRKNE